MRRSCVLAFALIGLAACTHVEPLESYGYGPEAYALSCGAIEACERKAARLCPSGYDEIDPDIGTRIFATLVTVEEGVRSIGYLLTFRQPKGDRVLYVSCVENAAQDG